MAAKRTKKAKKTAGRRPAKPARKPAKKAKPSRKPAKKAKKAKPARKPAKKAKPAKKKAAKKPAKPARSKSKAKPPKRAAKKKTAKKAPSRAPKTARASTKKAKKSPQHVGAVKQRFRKPVAPKDTIRRPQDIEGRKQKLGALAQATSQIRGLKRSLNKSFYDIGQILRRIETERLYEVKGYGSFEAFVDREIDLGKQLSLKIVRIVQTFIREAAESAGLERVTAALDALEDDGGESAPAAPTTTSSGGRSPIPFHKR